MCDRVMFMWRVGIALLVFVWILAAISGWAQSVSPPPIAEVDLLKLSLLQAERATLFERSQTLLIVQNQIQAEHMAKGKAYDDLVAKLAGEAKLDLKEWELDMGTGLWKKTRAAPPPAK